MHSNSRDWRPQLHHLRRYQLLDSLEYVQSLTLLVHSFFQALHVCVGCDGAERAGFHMHASEKDDRGSSSAGLKLTTALAYLQYLSHIHEAPSYVYGTVYAWGERR